MTYTRKKHLILSPHNINRIKKKNDKEVRRIIKIIGDNSKTIFDVGAFIGTFSLSFANRFKNNDVKIYAFEPVESNYRVILENIKLNNFEKWIKLFNFGFYDEEVEVSMGVPVDRISEKNNGLYTVDTGNETLGNMLTCKMMKLKNFVKDNNIDDIDIIKIDAEGSELIILEDSVEIFPRIRYIHVEINNYFDDAKCITTFLKKNGFSYVENTHNINEVWKNERYWRLNNG